MSLLGKAIALDILVKAASKRAFRAAAAAGQMGFDFEQQHPRAQQGATGQYRGGEFVPKGRGAPSTPAAAAEGADSKPKVVEVVLRRIRTQLHGSGSATQVRNVAANEFFNLPLEQSKLWQSHDDFAGDVARAWGSRVAETPSTPTTVPTPRFSAVTGGAQEARVGAAPDGGRSSSTGAKREKPAKREPWQMTREEFVTAGLEQTRQEEKGLAPGHRFNMQMVQHDLEAMHRTSVSDAVRYDGKPVPPEVLADYPEYGERQKVLRGSERS